MGREENGFHRNALAGIEASKASVSEKTTK